MQQAAPSAPRKLLEGVHVGVIAPATPEIDEIERALRDAGAAVSSLSVGYFGWQGDTPFDVMLIRIGADDGPSTAQSRRQAADIEAFANSHRVIALADSSSEVITLGVRDFVTPPYRPTEVVMRVARVLRGPAPEVVLRVGNLEVNVANRQVSVGGRPVEVTFGEFELLRTLLLAKGTPVSRNGLLGHAPPSDRGAARWVDMHIHRLRAKLSGLRGARIDTVRGVGYRLGPE